MSVTTVRWSGIGSPTALLCPICGDCTDRGTQVTGGLGAGLCQTLKMQHIKTIPPEQWLNGWKTAQADQGWLACAPGACTVAGTPPMSVAGHQVRFKRRFGDFSCWSSAWRPSLGTLWTLPGGSRCRPARRQWRKAWQSHCAPDGLQRRPEGGHLFWRMCIRVGWFLKYLERNYLFL